MKQGSFLARLAAVDNLTPSEKILARYCEKTYPTFAFDNLAGISTKAGVSKSTASRFTARLGYKDFHVFLRLVRAEIADTFDNPLKRHAELIQKRGEDKQKYLSIHLEEVRYNLLQTLERVDAQNFDTALDLLCNDTRPLVMLGCASAGPIVEYFYLLASYLRRNITLLDGNASTIAHKMDTIDTNAVLFAMAFYRYPTTTAAMLQYFKNQGCESILLTDRTTCPMLGTATVPLIVHAEGSNMFKTRAPAMAVMEAFLAGMAQHFKKNIPTRYKAMGELMQHLGVYLQD